MIPVAQRQSQSANRAKSRWMDTTEQRFYSRAGFLKITSVRIPTYHSMKTGF